MPKRLSNDQIEERKNIIAQQVALGKSYADIQREYGFPVTYFLKTYGRPPDSLNDELPQWIGSCCLTYGNRLNNFCTKKEWWVSSGYVDKYNEILEQTSWLDTDKFSERIYHVFHGSYTIPLCEVCGNPTKFKNFVVGYYRLCSRGCITKSNERNRKISENNDYEAIARSVKKTNLQKYGVEHFYQTEEFKAKAAKTKLERYGDENYHNRTLVEKTNLRKYGVKTLLGLPEFQEKLRQARIDKYGSLSCNNDHYSTSKQEIELVDFLNSLGKGTFEKSWILQSLELDGYCEERQMAVEFCGLYWHSERFKKRHYHRFKHDLCKSKGIRLFTIFEDEWLSRNKQVKQFLRASLGAFQKRINARDCVFTRIETQSCFFSDNHIQGSPTNIQYQYGLLYDDQLVGSVSFAPHHRTNSVLTLNRLAFADGVQVIGGASKLIKHSLAELDQTVVTWSDNRWSSGEIYRKCGFTMGRQYYCDYSYVGNNGERYSKQSMMKKNIGCPSDVKEHEWVRENYGLYRIYDCGKVQWIKEENS